MRDYKKIQETIANLEAQDPFNDPDHTSDNAAIDTDVREQIGHETVEAETKSLARRLKLVENAMRKMEEGTYGFDEQTGEPISFERLMIMPEAQHTTANEARLVK